METETARTEDTEVLKSSSGGIIDTSATVVSMNEAFLSEN
jgi:hypothetical protein